jgi:hypothetical protein
MTYQKPTQPELAYSSLEAQAKATLETWMNMQRPVFTMVTEIQGRLLDQAFRVNQAWMGFVGRQIEHEIEATRRLLGCRNVQDVMVTYRDVIEEAQRDAKIDIDLLSRVNREAATETVAAFREGLSEAAQELRP